jgi:hypothetical protein
LPAGDLDEALRAMLIVLKGDVASRHPALAQARAVVGNFTEAGRPFAGPLGAVLQERTAVLVRAERLFEPPARQDRTVALGDVAKVPSPNAAAAQAVIYGAEITIAGRYRAEGERIAVELSALDPRGQTLAVSSRTVVAPAAPSVLPPAAANVAETERLLASLTRLGPSRSDGRVDITTNRPGEGASFRLDDEIRYLVVSTTAGYLYLFHIDAEGRVVRIFPNDQQREARIDPTSLEVPAPNGPARFVASPPFGLETTVALVAASPIEQAALREIAATLSRAASPRAAGPGPSPTPVTGVLWSSVTTLIRP